MELEEYKSLEGRFKVGVVLALEEKINKDKKYKGLTIPEIKQKVRKYDASISDEELSKAVQSAYDWRIAKIFEIEGGKDKWLFRFNKAIYASNFDSILELIGFTKRTEEVLVK